MSIRDTTLEINACFERFVSVCTRALSCWIIEAFSEGILVTHFLSSIPPICRDDPAAESAGGATKKTSKLAAFLSTNKAENHVPVFGVDDAADGDHDKGEERLCESAGCTNRAVENLGVCPSHTKR